MNYIEFDLSSLENVLKRSGEINGEVSASLYDFRELKAKAEDECGQVVAALTNKINYLNSGLDGIRQAKANTANRLAQAQAAEEKSRAEAERNGEQGGNSYAGEISRLQRELDSISSVERTVEDCISRLTACRNKTVGKQNEFEQKSAMASQQLERASDGMARFCSAMNDTYLAAGNILNCKMQVYGNGAFIQMFDIETSGRVYVSGSRGSDHVGEYSFGSETFDTKKSAAKKCAVIKSRDIGEMIAGIEDFACGDTLKIPSANYHALGANDLVRKLDGLGFEQVLFGGHIIDDNGYMVWRKK